MKEKPVSNHLCISCRRQCKQAASVVIASCPRYYPGPRIKHTDWKQLTLEF